MAMIKQHHVGELALLGQLRNHEVVRHLGEGRMRHERDRHEQEAGEDERHGEALEAAEIAGAHGRHDEEGRKRDADRLGQAEIIERERDADELGDDGERVEQEEIDDAERAPELAEALEDEPRMPDAGHRAKPQHHLLIHVEHRDQKGERPQQRRAVILARLRVGPECARVIVADHDDQAGAEDCEQRPQPMLPAETVRRVVSRDGAERADDVA